MRRCQADAPTAQRKKNNQITQTDQSDQSNRPVRSIKRTNDIRPTNHKPNSQAIFSPIAPTSETNHSPISQYLPDIPDNSDQSQTNQTNRRPISVVLPIIPDQSSTNQPSCTNQTSPVRLATDQSQAHYRPIPQDSLVIQDKSDQSITDQSTNCVRPGRSTTGQTQTKRPRLTSYTTADQAVKIYPVHQTNQINHRPKSYNFYRLIPYCSDQSQANQPNFTNQ